MSVRIYTKKGDAGQTSIRGTRTRYSKCHLILQAVGTVDELNAYIGMIRSFDIGLHNLILEQIQDDLFVIGAELANAIEEKCDIDITFLESSIDTMSTELEPLRNFILPSGNQAMCYCHIARTVCRRAERVVVELEDFHATHKIDPVIMSYINRLSDYLFVLSRKLGQEMNVQETIWKKKIFE